MNQSRRQEYVDRLLSFLNGSPTAFHATANAEAYLAGHGFSRLREEEPWTLEPGGKYYVKRNNSALIAFERGTADVADSGFGIIGAHTDSPSFKIKPGGCMLTGDGYRKINTEPYGGGGILSTWFDRPLSIAGRVILKTDNAMRPEERLVDLGRPVAVIPNLCIHFNREINSGYSYNKQIDMLPLLGLAGGASGDDPVPALAAAELQIDASRIIDHDLFLYESAPGCLTGVDGEFISASRIDNLSMVHAGLDGLVRSGPAARTKILAAFDNEEVGSVSAPGANSGFLMGVLRRICLCSGAGEEGVYRALAGSVAISADCAHAVHPNYPEKHDPVNRPVLGAGPVIKYSAPVRYATNAVTAAIFAQVCEEANVPCQKFVNRSDIPGGSTIGPAMSSLTSVPTVDVGTPVLAMHSVREFGSVCDNVHTARAFAAFYSYPGGA